MRRNVPLFLLIACVSDLLTFDVEQDASTVVTGAGALGIFLDALSLSGLQDMDVAVEQELQNQGVAADDVNSITVTTFTLSTPDGDDLSFLDEFAVYVSADGLERAPLAHGSDFPEGVTSVELVIDGTELAPYVTADSMTIETTASGEAPFDDTTVDAHIVLSVEATVKAACEAAQGQ